MKNPLPHDRLRHGFTLVELLVVIGIIALLLGILLPVINAVRKSAYVADSRNQLRGIANGIDRYYNDFTAYPGVFSNADVGVLSIPLYPGTKATPGSTTGNDTLTSSENLFISLCGGANVGGYYAGEAGKGSMGFNSVQPKRYAPYVEATSALCSMAGSSLEQTGFFGTAEYVANTSGVNRGIPEFIDRFPESRLNKSVQEYLNISQNNIKSLKNEQVKKAS